VVLRTERLLLRRWRASDRDAYAAMNADPVVMEHFAKLLSRAESDDHVDRIEARFRDEGYGLWAVEVPGVAEFIGFVGLWAPGFDAHFTPAVEVGWRLMPEHWGNGYAVEGAVASMDDGFARLELDEIVSMTTPANLRSQRVM